MRIDRVLGVIRMESSMEGGAHLFLSSKRFRHLLIDGIAGLCTDRNGICKGLICRSTRRRLSVDIYDILVHIYN